MTWLKDSNTKLNGEQTVASPIDPVVSSELKTQATAMATHLKRKGFRGLEHDWIYDQILDALESGY